MGSVLPREGPHPMTRDILERAAEALEPFSAHADTWDNLAKPFDPSRVIIGCGTTISRGETVGDVTIADVRRARTVLAELREEIARQEKQQ